MILAYDSTMCIGFFLSILQCPHWGHKMLIDFLGKSCNTHIKKHKMLIGFWVVHGILTQAQNMHPEWRGKKGEKQEGK
jgi:hypothetical protein